ncbi:hypothetical protein BH24ACT3_BH24ACT3_08380 [soil metagenome]
MHRSVRHRPVLLLAALVVLGTGAQAATSGTHVVREGETLTSIAAEHGVPAGAMGEANGLAEPDLIRPGERLQLPGPNGGGTTSTGAAGSYTVQPGDTLSGIAADLGSTTAELAAVNGLDDRDHVVAGRDLQVPTADSGSTPSELAPSATGTGLPSRLARDPGRQAFAATFDRWAAQYGVPGDLLKAMTWMDSCWQNDVVSSTGAMGIGQLMPDTVDFVGDVLIGEDLDPADPEDNIRMSARFLAYLLGQCDGDTRTTLAAYYQGLRAVNERGIYAETETYIDTVLALRSRF